VTTENKDESLSDAGIDVVANVAGGLTGLAVADSPEGIILVSVIVSKTAKVFMVKANAASAALFAAFSKLRGNTKEQTDKEITDLLNNEDTSDRVTSAVRSAIDSPQLASIDALAALLSLYANPSDATDAFFRSAARMLADCDASDLKDLCATVTAIRDSLGVFPERVFITANAPDSVGKKTPRDPKKPRLAEPGTLLVSDGTSARRVIGGKGARVAASGATVGKGGGTVAGVPYDRAIQVVQRLGAVGIGLPRTENGAESVAVLRGTLYRLAHVLGVETETTGTKA